MRAWWIDRKDSMAVFTLACAMVVIFLMSVIRSYPVQAATPAPPTVTACVKVSEVTTKAGLLIEDFRCEDKDMDYVFYKNSLGFTWNRNEQ